MLGNDRPVQRVGLAVCGRSRAGSGPASGPSGAIAARIHRAAPVTTLTVPLTTAAGLADWPGEISGIGPVEPDPRRALRLYARSVTAIHGRSADVHEVLRAAATSDKDLYKLWRAGEDERCGGAVIVVDALLQKCHQGGPGPRRRHRHRVDLHLRRHLLAACAHPAMERRPVRELARRHAVRTASAASRTAVRVVARRLRDWPTGQMLPVAALGCRLLRERDAEWPRRRVPGPPAISVAFSSGLIRAGGRGPSRSRRSHPTGRERCRRAAARRCRSG